MCLLFSCAAFHRTDRTQTVFEGGWGSLGVWGAPGSSEVRPEENALPVSFTEIPLHPFFFLLTKQTKLALTQRAGWTSWKEDIYGWWDGGGVFLPGGQRLGALKPTLGPLKLKAITSQGENRLGSAAAPINGAGHGWKREAMDTITDTYWGAPDPSLTFSPKHTDRKTRTDNTREEELKVQINSFLLFFPLCWAK